MKRKRARSSKPARSPSLHVDEAGPAAPACVTEELSALAAELLGEAHEVAKQQLRALTRIATAAQDYRPDSSATALADRVREYGRNLWIQTAKTDRRLGELVELIDENRRLALGRNSRSKNTTEADRGGQ